MPCLPALYRPKRKWRLAAQADPLNYLEEVASWPESSWRSNYPSLSEHTERVVKVLEDQTSGRQLIKRPEVEARARYPNVVIASLGAIRKDKPNGEVSARVLFDGTGGQQVNTRTRLRDQERSAVAADPMRAMREKGLDGCADLCPCSRRQRSPSTGADPPSGLAPSGLPCRQRR